MTARDIPVLDASGAEVERLPFDPAWLGGRVRRALLRQMLVGYEANRRRGTHKTKERGELPYSRKKMWKQKGTGRARVGDRATPLWRHGGVIFGPRPRSYRQILPRGMRRAALRSALLSAFEAGALRVVQDAVLAFEAPRTKRASEVLRALSLARGCLVATDGLAPAVLKSFRNLRRCAVLRASDLNAWEVLRYPALLFPRSAWEGLVQRLRDVASKRGAAKKKEGAAA